MDYDLKKPCECCPFRRGTPMILTEDRVLEITDNILGNPGGEFPCHRTIEHDDDGEGFGARNNGKIKHCAGALIFSEKQNKSTQMMRISERLGMYDAKALMDNQEIVDIVFDDVTEMLEHNLNGMGVQRRSRKKKRSK